MKFPGNQRGNAIVEFAIGVTVMVGLFLGAFQFGYAFYIYNNLLSAVDHGARYAALKTYDSASCNPSSAFSTAVKNMVLYGQPAAGSKPVAPGLKASNVVVTPGGSCNSGPPTEMTVSLRDYSLYAVVATYNLSKPTVTYPYLGVYATVP